MVERDALTDTEAARVAEVFEENRRFIESVARLEVNGDAVEAAEILQEVGVRICRTLNGLRDQAAIRSWLYRLTVNAARDRRDSRQAEARAFEKLQVEEAVDGRLDERLDQADRRRVLQGAIQRLPAFERDVVRRRFGLGRFRATGERTLEEVSRELDATVSKTFRAETRGISRLRAFLLTSRGHLSGEKS